MRQRRLARRSSQRGFITPALLGVVARRYGGGATGPLAPYTANLWGCYSLTQLLTSYAGDCLKIRRSSDNATQDIGFSSGVIDVSALLSFVGANDGFVETWYDQSGGGNDFTQATTTKQPRLVRSGAFMGEVCFDGSDDTMATVTSSGTPTGISVYMGGRDRFRGPTSVLWNWATQSFAADGAESGGAGSYGTSISINDAGNACGFDTPSVADGTTFAWVFDRAEAIVPQENRYYIDGTLQTALSSTGTPVTGNFTSAAWHLGSNYLGTNPAVLALSTFLLYEAAHSGATVSAIGALIEPAALYDGLDSYTTNLWSAVGLWKLRSAYGGNCLRIRRSSDNTEQDIGFSGDVIDTASLLSFVGAGNGLVVKWYDQSGNGNDFEQTTTANQPLLVLSGIYLGNVNFGGTTRSMFSTTNTGAVSAFSCFLKGQFGTPVENVMEQSTNYNTQTGAVLYKNSGTSTAAGLTQTSSTNRSESTFNIGLDRQILSYRLDRAAGTAAAQVAMFSGGFKLTRVSNGDQGTLPSGNFVANKWFFGGRNNTLTFNNDASVLVIYETAISDSDMDEISRLLG